MTIKRRRNFAYATEIYHCKSIVRMLIINKSHLDKRDHGL